MQKFFIDILTGELGITQTPILPIPTNIIIESLGTTAEIETPQPSVIVTPSSSGTVTVAPVVPSVAISPNNSQLIEVIVGEPSAGGVLTEEARIAFARDPDTLVTGALTRSTTDALTSADVVWPDGKTGTFTGVESGTFPGAVDTYTITYVGDVVTKTYTQPSVTRDSSGTVTDRPDIIVS